MESWNVRSNTYNFITKGNEPYNILKAARSSGVFLQAASMASAASEGRKILQSQESSRTISHPMALRKRLKAPRAPRPARRLPQV